MHCVLERVGRQELVDGRREPQDTGHGHRPPLLKLDRRHMRGRADLALRGARQRRRTALQLVLQLHNQSASVSLRHSVTDWRSRNNV